MRIRMLKSERGSVDGIRSSLYEAGQEYDLGGNAGEVSLAEAFVGAGLAEDAEGTAAPKESAAPKLSIGEMRDALTARGIEFPADAKKADLQALLDQPQ